MKKKKILIVMVEQFKHEGMLARELKELAEEYEVLLAHSIVDDLTKIAIAALMKKNLFVDSCFKGIPWCQIVEGVKLFVTLLKNILIKSLLLST